MSDAALLTRRQLQAIARAVTLDLAGWESDSSARQAVEELRRGKWRKARDAAKALCRTDHARYLPLLLMANEGLYNDLLAKGLRSDAEQVLAYLKTIAPAGWTARLEQKREETKTLNVPAPLVKASQAAWQKAEELARRLANDEPVSASDWEAADTLLALPVGAAPLQAGETASAVAGELACLRAAIDATGDGRWEDAQAALRQLPRRSIFQHWRMLLRGIRHASQNEPAEAARAFATLPPGTRVEGAATPWLALLAETHDGPALPASAALALGPMAGLTGAQAAGVAKAESAWRDVDFMGTLKALSTGFGSRFPVLEPGAGLEIAESLLASLEWFRPDLRDDALAFAEDVTIEARQPSTRRPQEIFHLKRWALDIMGFTLEYGEVCLLFDDVRKAFQRAYPGQPVGEAVLLLKHAELLQRHMGYFCAAEGSERPNRRMESVLADAIRLDPGSEAAHHALLGHFQETRNEKALTALVESMLDRFPGNKPVRIVAAERAFARRAWGKALRFYGEVREIDPLDREAPAQMVMAHLHRARESAKKRPGAIPGIWEELDAVLATARPEASDPWLERWAVRLMQALLDPDPQRAADLRREGCLGTRLHLHSVLVEKLAAAYFSVPNPHAAEWTAQLALASWAELPLILKMLRTWDLRTGRDGGRNVAREVAKRGKGFSSEPAGPVSLRGLLHDLLVWRRLGDSADNGTAEPGITFWHDFRGEIEKALPRVRPAQGGALDLLKLAFAALDGRDAEPGKVHKALESLPEAVRPEWQPLASEIAAAPRGARPDAHFDDDDEFDDFPNQDVADLDAQILGTLRTKFDRRKTVRQNLKGRSDLRNALVMVALRLSFALADEAEVASLRTKVLATGLTESHWQELVQLAQAANPDDLF